MLAETKNISTFALSQLPRPRDYNKLFTKD